VYNLHSKRLIILKFRQCQMIKTCPICKVEFTTERQAAIYCSARCRNVGHIKQVVLNCLNCKQDFSIRYCDRLTRKYCSMTCKQTHLSNVKVCKNCQKSYSGSKAKVFCSETCRLLFRKKNVKTVKCVSCNQSFTANLSRIENNRAKYCSKNCQVTTIQKLANSPLNLEKKRTKARINDNNRRTREQNVAGHFSLKQWQEKLTYFGYRCYLCHESLKEENPYGT
jgi:endogenous inhibitor of DNA gyrase (YacG/DUF329 family)